LNNSEADNRLQDIYEVFPDTDKAIIDDLF